MLVKAVIASSRVVTGRVLARRALSTTKPSLAASILKMPAMSPTMTEGGIVDWKVKEGDEYSAGDILLEIETDKAQIDVEAQDDGIMAKIYSQNGAKGVQVGDGIAVTAEPGDDVSTLEIPAESEMKAAQKEESAPAPAKEESPKKEAPKEEAPKKEAKKETKKASKPQSAKANPNQTLLPSVAGLINAKNISKGEALEKIPASGPSGRLLKGDVLAYFGSIPQEAVQIISDNISKTQHLDLSNIKIKEPEQPKEEPKKEASEAPKPEEPLVLRNAISLGELNLLKATAESTLHSQLSVRQLVDKASKLAQRDVPLLSKPRKSAVNDPLFDELVAPNTRGKRSYTIDISYPSFDAAATIPSPMSTQDVYDILSSPKRPVSRPVGRAAAPVAVPDVVSVAVTVNESVPGSTVKAQLYLDRLTYYLTAGKGDLVL